MIIDKYGTPHCTTDELCDLLYKHPTASLSDLQVDDPEGFNKGIKTLFADYPLLKKYIEPNIPVEEFDKQQQKSWHMPIEYKNLDIAEWILSQCKNDEELQRAGKELLMYQERDLFDMLKFMKYLVDTMRKHNIVWGVGRGSSVASFVLYLIGVHSINSIYYNLDISEFLK